MIRGAKLVALSNGKTTVINGNATNLELQKYVAGAYPAAVAQMQKSGFYKALQGDNVKETAANIWHYLKGHITYTKDPDGVQYIIMPARFARRKKGDCKNYSIFAASVLGACGYPVFFDFTNYVSKAGIKPAIKNMPTHVYVSTLDEKGRRVIVDGVYNKFNAEKPFYFKKIVPMRVEVLSGVGQLGTPKTMQIERNQYGSQAKQQQYKARVIKGEVTRLLNSDSPGERAKGKEYLQALQSKDISGIGGKKKKPGKKKGKGFKKVTLAAVRNPYLALVKLNTRGLAHKLSILLKRPGGEAKLKNTWENKLGGKFSVLKRAIETGKKKKPLLGQSAKNKSLKGIYGMAVDGESIGVVGAVTVGSMLAAAAGAIAAIAPLLKGININKEGAEAANAAPGSSDLDLLNDSVANGGQPNAPLPPADNSSGGGFLQGETFGIPNVGLVVGGGLAAYMLLGKKGKRR